MNFSRLHKGFLALGLAVAMAAPVVRAAEGGGEGNAFRAGVALPQRQYSPEQVQQALAGIDARRQQFYEGLATRSLYKRELTILAAAMGRYGLNRDLEQANQMMLEKYPAAQEETVKAARGPWYSFVREARMYHLFSSRSKVHPGRMSLEVENMLLGRMWQWASTTARLEFTLPERDWWSLGSENHWMSLWAGMCVTANIFADHPDYKDRKYADGTSVPDMARAFNERFKRLCRDRASKGLMTEVNSHYNKQTLSGMMNIADFSPDPVLKRRMCMLLDVYWADWAIEQLDGLRGGSRSRSYNDSISRVTTSMMEGGWYLFGVGDETHMFSPDFWTTATTLYRPDPIVVELVLDTQGRGSYAHVSRRPGKREPGTTDKDLAFVTEPKDHILNIDKVQALDDDGGGVVRYTWATPDFVMGCSMVEAQPSDFWVNFSSQNRWDGVLFGGHSTARIYCQPVGALQGGRGSFFNANWSVQSKGVQVIQRLKDTMSDGADNQRVWFDNVLQRAEKEGWVFCEGPRAFAAVRVVDGPTEWQDDVPPRPEKGDVAGPGKWLFCKNEFTPVIIEVVRKSDYPSFSQFQEAILGNPISWKDNKLDYRSGFYKTQVTFFADHSQPPQVDGTPVNYSPAKVYDSPFLQGEFGSGVVTLIKGDKKRVLDFNQE